MKSNRWTVAGPVTAQDLGLGSWRLVAGADPSIEILIRGAGQDAAECLGGPIAQLAVQWGSPGPHVCVTRGGRERVVEVRSVVVHEPRPQLYDALPLARFDVDARRFWSRIFRIMRLPGGRWLLRLMTRRRRR